MKPDKEKLNKCIQFLAEAMKFSSFPDDKTNQLIDHVFFLEEYDGIKGKEAWLSFENHLITERELRNLFMTQVANKIAKYNKKDEPAFTDYSTKELCQKIELVLLGKLIVPTDVDVFDPWESKNV